MEPKRRLNLARPPVNRYAFRVSTSSYCPVSSILRRRGIRQAGSRAGWAVPTVMHLVDTAHPTNLMRRPILIAVYLAAVCLLAVRSDAEVFILKSGGRIEAEHLNPNRERGQPYYLRTES